MILGAPIVPRISTSPPGHVRKGWRAVGRAASEDQRRDEDPDFVDLIGGEHPGKERRPTLDEQVRQPPPSEFGEEFRRSSGVVGSVALPDFTAGRFERQQPVAWRLRSDGDKHR